MSGQTTRHFDHELTIQKSDMIPPRPMQMVMEALAALDTGQVLLVRHVQRPIHLFAVLEGQGHRYDVEEIGPADFRIWITKGSSL